MIWFKYGVNDAHFRSHPIVQLMEYTGTSAFKYKCMDLQSKPARSIHIKLNLIELANCLHRVDVQTGLSQCSIQNGEN